MTLPENYTVEGTVDWHDEHPDPHHSAQDLGKALSDTGFSILYDEASGDHVLVSEGGDEA